MIEVVEACIDGTLDQIDLQFEDNAAVCVVLASQGYPVSYEKGFAIAGLERFEDVAVVIVSDTAAFLALIFSYPLKDHDAAALGTYRRSVVIILVQ